MRRFRIQDTSMQPVLQPGDRVLVYQWARPTAGDVVVVREPDQLLTFAVKRVADVGAAGELVLRGDLANVSRDSRHYGPVPRRLVMGTVVYRYSPPAARGRLARSG